MSKTHIKKLRNPNYIGSWDLFDDDGNATNKIVTITGIKKEPVHDGKGGQEDCTVMYLKETKPMILNATNIKMLCAVLGSPFIEDWYGRQIELTVSKVKAFGEIHDALRIVGRTIYAPNADEVEQRERAQIVAFLKSPKLTLACNFCYFGS